MFQYDDDYVQQATPKAYLKLSSWKKLKVELEKSGNFLLGFYHLFEFSFN